MSERFNKARSQHREKLGQSAEEQVVSVDNCENLNEQIELEDKVAQQKEPEQPDELLAVQAQNASSLKGNAEDHIEDEEVEFGRVKEREDNQDDFYVP